MIGALTRVFDNVFGRGEAAVTVPPLDGALRPNRELDEATARFPLADVDSLAVVAGEFIAAAGKATWTLEQGAWRKREEYGAEIACIAPIGTDGLAVALVTGDILCRGGKFDGRRYEAGKDVKCITALAATGTDLYVANGSASNAPDGWQRDLLERNASGSILQIDLGSGRATRLAGGLAWPAGLALDGGKLVVSEAWKHRLVRIDPSAPARSETLYADLPGYPGRLAPAPDGYWLAVFAPRSQLVEFVLREPGYRKRMMAEVPQPFWVAPRLRSGRSFYETLQGGGVKHLGMLKPWAPTMSAGLCVKLDRAFQPRFSLQSRADGATHGVTAAAEHQGQVFVAAHGDGVVVALSLLTSGADRGSAT
jgi:hypothetical protein